MRDEAKPLTVRKIVEGWLMEHGFDGLYHYRAECICRLSELMTCDEGEPTECQPGYLVVECSEDCDEAHAFHIVGEKPKGGAE